MKSTLYIKFLIIYIIFGFLSLFTIALLGDQVIEKNLITKTVTKLNTNVNMISQKDIIDSKTNKINYLKLKTFLQTTCFALESDGFVVLPDGEIIITIDNNHFMAPYSKIEDFDPLVLSGKTHLLLLVSV